MLNYTKKMRDVGDLRKVEENLLKNKIYRLANFGRELCSFNCGLMLLPSRAENNNFDSANNNVGTPKTIATIVGHPRQPPSKSLPS